MFRAQNLCRSLNCPSTQMSVMTDCPVGKFWVAGSSTFADCAAGTYNDRVKATAQSDCKACPPGQYWTGGSSASNGNWNAGYYWRASSTSATPSGSATNFGVCPAGYYCPAGTGDPIQWPPGTFNPNTQSTSSTACQTCTAGSYCSQPNLSAVEGQCPVCSNVCLLRGGKGGTCWKFLHLPVSSLKFK